MRVALCFVFVAVLMLGGCSKKSPSPAPKTNVVAQVGSREITIAHFQDWMQRRGVGTNLVQKEALLSEVIDHYAAVQKARDLGLDRRPDLQRAWENMLVNALRERQLESQLTNPAPAREEVDAYYQANLASFSEPAQRRAAILFVEIPTKAGADQKSGALQRLTEARYKALQQTNAPSGRGFGALAVEYSDDQLTRYKGGDTGWLIEGKSDYRFDTNVLGVIFSLPQTNALSEIIETARGLYLVKLMEARPPRSKPLESVRAMIQQKLLVEKRRRAESNWHGQLRAGLSIQIFTNTLPAIPAPATLSVPGAAGPPTVP